MSFCAAECVTVCVRAHRERVFEKSASEGAAASGSRRKSLLEAGGFILVQRKAAPV